MQFHVLWAWLLNFIDQEKLLTDFIDISSSFEYDLANFNGGIEESERLLIQLVSMIESKTKPQTA